MNCCFRSNRSSVTMRSSTRTRSSTSSSRLSSAARAGSSTLRLCAVPHPSVRRACRSKLRMMTMITNSNRIHRRRPPRAPNARGYCFEVTELPVEIEPVRRHVFLETLQARVEVTKTIANARQHVVRIRTNLVLNGVVARSDPGPRRACAAAGRRAITYAMQTIGNENSAPITTSTRVAVRSKPKYSADPGADAEHLAAARIAIEAIDQPRLRTIFRVHCSQPEQLGGGS